MPITRRLNRAFYRLTVLPLAGKVTAAISHWLSTFTGEEVELRPDPDQVPALAVQSATSTGRASGRRIS
jgi:phage portal protein BeeE